MRFMNETSAEHETFNSLGRGSKTFTAKDTELHEGNPNPPGGS
jgi:hypothetical protein